MENLETTATERLVRLIVWEKMYGFVKDNYKHNPKFLEYDEILNDENEMFEWFKQWHGDFIGSVGITLGFTTDYDALLKQLTK